MPEISHEIGKERESAHLLKTGQTTQYGGYEDDGYFEKGLSKQYDILTTGRYAGTTNITLNAKTDAHSNNCVYDRRTKLMWSRYVVASVGPLSNGRLPFTTNVNGEGIFAFVAAAKAALLGGYGDWRVCNIFELIGLFVYEAPLATPNPVAFPGFPAPGLSGALWTSTTRADNTSLSVRINRNMGGDIDDDLKTSNYLLMLVRGG